MSDYDMSDLDGHEGGQEDGGHDGYGDHGDGGYEQHGLVAAHDAQGDEHDQFQHYQGYGETHEQEHDEHYKHIHQVEYDDGKGGHYKVTDITVIDEHSESSDSVFGQEYTEAEHDASFHDLETLRDSFVSHLGEIGQAFGYGDEHALGRGGEDEGGQQALSEVSN